MAYVELAFLFLLNIIGNLATSDFVIVADLDNATIQTAPIDTLQFAVIPLYGLSRPVAVDYDPVEQKVYWTDVVSKTINRAFLNGTGQDVVASLSTLSVPDGIALDVENRHMYWTDAGYNRIERATLDGSSRQIILQENLDEPRAIVVDPAGRELYWTDWGDRPKIERAKLDGTDRVTLVDTGLQWPNGLAIDFAGQRIYWCDAGLKRIETTDLHGGDRNQLFTNPDIHPFDIGVYGDDIYWTDWKYTKLITMNKLLGRRAEQVGPVVFEKAGGLHIHQENDGSCSSNICENGSRCRQLISSYQCVCLPGYSGTYCDVDINECSSNPCSNGGRCLDMIDSFSCNCDTIGWTGEICETDVNECSDIPNVCHTYSLCINTPGSYLCECRPGYTGDGRNSCTVIDNCNSDPCKNGGACTNRINDFDCECLYGFTGDRCQIAPPDPCRYQPCRNSGTCRSSGDQFTCQCQAGFTGYICDTDLDECNSSPCQNGGTCLDLVNSFECNCVLGFQGGTCDMQITTVSSGCSHPGSVENGYVILEGDVYPPGESVQYVCKETYTLEGHDTRYCQSDHMWSDKQPVCVQVKEKKSTLNTYVVVGVGAAVGVIISVLVIILLVVCSRKRRQSNTASMDQHLRQQPLEPKKARPFTPVHNNAAYAPEPDYSSRISMISRSHSLHIYDILDEPLPIDAPTRQPPEVPQEPPPDYDTLKNTNANAIYDTPNANAIYDKPK